MSTVIEALELVFQVDVLVIIFLASLVGLVLGAIPGLTATLGVALLIPFTYFMDPVPAIASIASLAAMAIFAGDVPGALLRIPGTPASAAYVDEAHQISLQGRPGLALSLSLVPSIIGGVIGVILLFIAAPILAFFATNFSTAEYFWLVVIGLSCAPLVSHGSTLKGLLSTLFGLFVASIGLDVMTGQPRFTLGTYQLMGGINFIAAMIGLFAIPEIIDILVAKENKQVPPNLGPVFKGLVPILKRRWRNLIRGSLVGTVVGSLPGAGADIAAWVTYGMARVRSSTPEKFGTGHDEGLIEAGAANNSALAGAWVPTLVFGIPGDTITAIVIGVLYLKGLEPGPAIFIKTPEIVYAIFTSFLVANLLLIPLGWILIQGSRHVLRLKPGYFMPVVLMSCVIGSFAITNSYFGVGTMLVFGIIGWIFEHNDIPLAPAVLGIVLGSMLEYNFVFSFMKAGGVLGLVNRPTSAGLAVLVVLLWLVALFRYGRAKARQKRSPE